MKSLPQINRDNRMTNRDFGSMCDWAVFFEGDFVGQFVKEEDAREFASDYEYKNGPGVTISEAKP